MKLNKRFLAAGGALAAGLVVVGAAVAMPASQASPSTPNSPEAVRALAAQSAANLVAGHPAALRASAQDKFVQHGVVSSQGTQYVAYDRTFKDLPVIGGDFVVVTDSAGQVKYTSVAQDQAIPDALSTTPAVTAQRAGEVARAQLKHVKSSVAPSLAVYAAGTPKLAWNTRVTGDDGREPSSLSVYVDAQTGAVLGTQEHVMFGTGTAGLNGPNPVHIDTSSTGGGYSMTDPNISNLSCGDYDTGQVFTKSSDTWGNGDETNRETGCVDALFAAQTENKMLASWLGRNGQDGNGGAWPIHMGLNDVNAYYDGSEVNIGHNQAGSWIPALDVVGHEMGHGIDDHTPGGISGNGTQEFVADTFGAETEWYANEPSPYDVPDFTVGEQINLTGNGPIRYMYDPSKAGHPNCYSSSIPTTEVHAAAGPGNHWFYLVAEGTNPTDGQPSSPTCNGSSVTGIGIQNAAKVMYNAMLQKTSGASYLKYRVWTLQAAKNLFPNDCTEFNTVKAAWDAVSVPAQSGEPTCSGGTTTTTTPPTSTTTPPPGNCSGQIIANPGFESGATSWTASSGVIGQYGSSGEPTHGGTWEAWLNGYGSSHTDTLSQSVTIPAGCHASLSFYLHVDTAETTTTTAYDKLTVKAGSNTLATYSNLNAGSGYAQKTFDVSALAGQTVTLTFTGVEDASLQTSFVIDDAALTLS